MDRKQRTNIIDLQTMKKVDYDLDQFTGRIKCRQRDNAQEIEGRWKKITKVIIVSLEEVLG